MKSGLSETRVGLAVDQADGRLRFENAYSPARVERLMHDALLAGGLGALDAEAPLKDAVQPGMRVLLKPNWVVHTNKSGYTLDCLVTHPEFVLAALDQICRARPERVVLGDAPIQTCNFNALVTSDFRARAAAIAWAAGVRLEIADFRRTVSDAGLNTGRQGQRSLERFLLFDIAENSLLEGLAHADNQFRVTNYDPRELASAHHAGTHQYLICKEVFESDVVISLPKLKTHCKAGLTGALKNLVGLNGSKDFLPHHRCGSAASGGDCYPQSSLRKKLAEYCLDRANKSIGRPASPLWRALAHARLGRLGAIEPYGLEGAWFGNDTVWRTVLDINRILAYGRSDGTLSDGRQRNILSLTDAIVCGQGDGPLAPTPLELNAVTFASNPAFADLVHAELLRFDWRKLPLVRESFAAFRHPLTETRPEAAQVVLTNRELTAQAAGAAFGKPAMAARGWVGHAEVTNETYYRHSA